jgi:hypothetical protein
MNPTVIRRYWESTKNGNNWYYMAEIKYDYAEKSQARQLGSVVRIVDERSPNFNKWLTSMAFEENQMMSRKKDAMAYVVAVAVLK